MAKRSSFGSRVRKRLSDITNSLPQPKSPAREEKPSPTASSAKEYIDHLVKEKMAQMRLIADKNKIIELNRIELQKLRVNLQKMQLQNWNLAQSNSHLLAELNLDKGKLKSLQHELVCKDALLKAKNLELEGQAKMNGEKNDTQMQEEVKEEHKFNSNGNRRCPTRSRSMGHSTTFQQVTEKETAENKRRRLRRQSANPKAVRREPKGENLFEIEIANSPMHVDSPTPPPPPPPSKHEAQESKRISIGRPSRRAVEKVQSYKEIPLNIKMRR